MRYTFGKPYVCFYCGEPADCIDHTIPYSWFRDAKEQDRDKKKFIIIPRYLLNSKNTS